MKNWETNSCAYCKYCGSELLERDGKTTRYNDGGNPYSLLTWYRCPKRKWWNYFAHEYYNEINEE